MKTVKQLGQLAKTAAEQLAILSADEKTATIKAIADNILSQQQAILDANAKDLQAAEEKGLSAALIDRLALNPQRVQAMADAVNAIAQLPDPVGKTLTEWDRPNGLHIQRVSVPLGVIAVIYESRPNVTADAAALCLKAGNAVILRGGSESFASAQAIMTAIQQALTSTHCPEHAVQMVETRDREAVSELLSLDKYIDVVVPRGGPSLINRVSEKSRIPVFKHLAGLCHTYVHQDADLAMARDIVINAKCRRPGICGATETLLIDQSIVDSHLPTIINALLEQAVEIRGDEQVQAINSAVVPASDQDWDTEYLDKIISIKVVDGIEQAIKHINRHGTQHTEAIVTEDKQAAQQFLNQVGSAIVLHNASTQFADGGEFGMGAEIGIATGKLHARGPVGVEQLTTYKYQVLGKGQTRPA